MKLEFGNLVSYTGKYLSTAKGKATGGNLVFAKITGSTTLATDHADYDKDGFYIFTPGAAGLMVTKEDFNALKTEVKALKDKVGTFDEVDVPAYVQARIAELGLGEASKLGVATTIRAKGEASNDVLATEAAVRDAVDAAIAAIPEVPVKDVTLNGTSVVGEDGVAAFTADTTVTKDSTNLVTSGAVEAAISSLGTVMEFKGVVEGENLPAVDSYNAGDVIIFKDKEYVLGTDNVWHEIGQVKEDESVISLAGKSGAITIGTGLVMGDDKKLDVKLAATQGNVKLDTTDGLSASVLAENIAYENTSHIDPANSVANVKAALDEIFDDELVIANSLVDLNTRLSGAEGDIADLKAGLDAVEHTTVSEGKDDDFITVSGTTVGNHTDYAISAEVVKGTAGDDAGLATDAYVRETAAAAVDTALTWEVLTDADGE